MYHGIYCVVNNRYRSSFWKMIVSFLYKSTQTWYIDCLDCLNDVEITNRAYTLRELQDLFDKEPDLFSARLLAVPINQPLNSSICTCDDYLSSNCECLILCVDGISFEIYIKDHLLLSAFYKHLLCEKNIQISLIDSSFGGRTLLTV